MSLSRKNRNLVLKITNEEAKKSFIGVEERVLSRLPLSIVHNHSTEIKQLISVVVNVW